MLWYGSEKYRRLLASTLVRSVLPPKNTAMNSYCSSSTKQQILNYVEDNTYGLVLIESDLSKISTLQWLILEQCVQVGDSEQSDLVVVCSLVDID
jgi:hypothetical protein